MNILRSRYRDHKWNATKVGKEFKLTFEEWLKIWVDSGHLEERGTRKGQYVMARNGDTGPYQVGNVRIILHVDNIKERMFSKEHIERCRQNRLGKPHLGPKHHTEETKKKISASNIATKAARPKTIGALNG